MRNKSNGLLVSLILVGGMALISPNPKSRDVDYSENYLRYPEAIIPKKLEIGRREWKFNGNEENY